MEKTNMKEDIAVLKEKASKMEEAISAIAKSTVANSMTLAVMSMWFKVLGASGLIGLAAILAAISKYLGT